MRPTNFHPATILATWFWIGLIRKAPGTWGSVAALPLAWLMQHFWGDLALLAGCVLVSVVGVWVAGHHATRKELHDPGEIVIDEVAGQWIACLALPTDEVWPYLLALVLFRVFDIAKPWPISVLDRHGRGGLGIMQDDILAGLFVFSLMQLLLVALEIL